eukprot:COSAG02_NODE_1022_length_15153_cov_3.631460_18_plen_103_part_00
MTSHTLGRKIRSTFRSRKRGAQLSMSIGQGRTYPPMDIPAHCVSLMSLKTTRLITDSPTQLLTHFGSRNSNSDRSQSLLDTGVRTYHGDCQRSGGTSMQIGK